MSKKRLKKAQKLLKSETVTNPEETAPDWTGECICCGERPTVPITKMCGPCTFGEADTAGGNW